MRGFLIVVALLLVSGGGEAAGPVAESEKSETRYGEKYCVKSPNPDYS
jgi:hypothetical protein